MDTQKYINFLNSLKTEENSLMEAIQTGFSLIFEGNNLPEGFSLDTLKSIKGYAGKIRYVETHLKKIGAGSSRIAYAIDDNTVLKMAKSDRGKSQNELEADTSNLYNNICSGVLDEDYQDNLWIISKRVNKLTSPKRFEELTKIPWDLYTRALNYEINGRLKGNKNIKRPEEMEQLYENEFFSSITDMAVNYGMGTGDLTRINSYADDNGRPVLMDSGLNEQVFNEHYKR